MVPRLPDYYAAADLSITRADRVTIAGPLCLGKPAAIAPIKRYFEQEDIIRDLGKRYSYSAFRE
ncbi:MAG: hypothetical protein ABWW69_07010, partial [Pyrodictiaceae archaeon]